MRYASSKRFDGGVVVEDVICALQALSARRLCFERGFSLCLTYAVTLHQALELFSLCEVNQQNPVEERVIALGFNQQGNDDHRVACALRLECGQLCDNLGMNPRVHNGIERGSLVCG